MEHSEGDRGMLTDLPGDRVNRATVRVRAARHARDCGVCGGDGILMTAVLLVVAYLVLYGTVHGRTVANAAAAMGN